MKCVVEVTEQKGEGLEAFLGLPILIFCANYIYTGKLVGINATCVKLEGARLVYETGAFTDSSYRDAQTLPGKSWYVGLSMIESFGPSK
jgi:hypothetical protein